MNKENTATETETPASAPKVERVKQNGFTRPLPGSKTGLVWDVADRLSAEHKRPALRDEVIAEYKKEVPDARVGTVSTQYSRWCGFHGVQDVLRKMRAEEKNAAEAEKAKAKAAKEAAKAEKAAVAKAKKAAAAAAKAEKEAAKADNE